MLIPIRKITIYMSADGKEIEMHEPTNYSYQDDSPDEELQDINKSIFIGVVTAQTQVGEQEIKFPIEKANTLPEAFKIFEESLQALVQNAENHIIIPSGEIMPEIDDIDNQGGLIL